MCLRTSFLDIKRQSEPSFQKTNMLFLCALFGSNFFFFDSDIHHQAKFDDSRDKEEHIILKEEPQYYLKIEFARVKKIRVNGVSGFRLTLKGISHELILQDSLLFA